MNPIIATAGMLIGSDWSFGETDPPPQGGGNNPGQGGPLRETVTIDATFDAQEEIQGDVDDEE